MAEFPRRMESWNCLSLQHHQQTIVSGSGTGTGSSGCSSDDKATVTVPDNMGKKRQLSLSSPSTSSSASSLSPASVSASASPNNRQQNGTGRTTQSSPLRPVINLTEESAFPPLPTPLSQRGNVKKDFKQENNNMINYPPKLNDDNGRVGNGNGNDGIQHSNEEKCHNIEELLMYGHGEEKRDIIGEGAVEMVSATPTPVKMNSPVNSLDKLNLLHYEKANGSQEGLFDKDKLAVGSGRPTPRKKSGLKLEEDESSPQKSTPSPNSSSCNWFPPTSYYYANTNGFSESLSIDDEKVMRKYSSMSLLSNGNGNGGNFNPEELKSVGVETQTASMVMQSSYSRRLRGSFQIWFVPDYHHDYGDEQDQSTPNQSQTQLDGIGAMSGSATVDSSTAPLMSYQVQQLQQGQLSDDIDSNNCLKLDNGTIHAYTDVYDSFETLTCQYSAQSIKSNENTSGSWENSREMATLTLASGNKGAHSQQVRSLSVDLSPNQTSFPTSQSPPDSELTFIDGLGLPRDDFNNGNDDLNLEMNAYISAWRMLEAGIVSDLFDSSESIMNPLPLQKPVELNYENPTGTLAQERPWLNRRKQNKRNIDIENALLWRGILLSKDTGRPIYSEKIFIGGIHLGIGKTDIFRGFQQFGVIDVSWCAMGGDRVILGCAYIVLANKQQVEMLLRYCRPRLSQVKCWKGQRTWRYDMPIRGGVTPVEVILWDVTQSEYSCENVPCDGNGHTVFLGNLHARFSAKDVAVFFKDQGFSDVKFIKIGIDKYEYPVGFARVTFGSFESFVKAVRARYLIVQTPEFKRTLQIEPFIEGNPCNLCSEVKATIFCRNEKCYNYYCEGCFDMRHKEGTDIYQENHQKDDMVTRTRRRKNSFNYYEPGFPMQQSKGFGFAGAGFDRHLL